MTKIKFFSQCCGSGIFIPDPDFYPSRIPDPGSRISDPGSKNSNKRERWKKISCHTFLCSHKFHKIVNYFSFEVLKIKIWDNFQRIIELFTKKIVKKLFKIWSWDPGSGIRDPGSGIRDPEKTYSGSRIPDPGVKKHPIPDPGSGSATLLFHFFTLILMPTFQTCLYVGTYVLKPVTNVNFAFVCSLYDRKNVNSKTRDWRIVQIRHWLWRQSMNPEPKPDPI